MSRLRLFDAIERTDGSGSRHAESRFAFLNRVRSQFFGNVRDLLEEWFEQWPPERTAQLRGRFRSDDERQMLGAFWELYLHEALRRLSFRITHEPDLGMGRGNPDFLAEREDGAFYLEATVAGPSDTELAVERRRNRVYDALNRLNSPDFILWLDVHAEGAGDPRPSRLRPKLERWLAGLRADAVARSYEERVERNPHSLAGLDGLPSHRWQEEGWDVVFRAIPKKPEARGDPSVRPIGAWGPAEAIRLDTSGPILRALESKASRYGQPNRPLVLAVLGYGSFVREWSIERALFGSEGYVFSADSEGEGPIRNPDGFWLGPKGVRYRRVAAVVGAANLLPWKVAGTAPHLWHNPWAEPLEVSFPWSTTRVSLSGNQGTFEHGKETLSTHELFGLPPEWPGPEDLEG